MPERKFTIFFFNQLILERITSLQKSGWKETILQFNSRQETSIRKKKKTTRIGNYTMLDCQSCLPSNEYLLSTLVGTRPPKINKTKSLPKAGFTVWEGKQMPKKKLWYLLTGFVWTRTHTKLATEVGRILQSFCIDWKKVTALNAEVPLHSSPFLEIPQSSSDPVIKGLMPGPAKSLQPLCL